MRPPNPLQTRIRALHRQHGFHVLHVLSKAGVPPAEVEDAAQEIWITVCSKLAAGLPEPDSWPAFLTTLARGRAANHRRALGHRPTTPIEAAPSVAAQGLSAEQILTLIELIESIPNADQREATLLRAQGYSIKEIAQRQGITESGVKKRLEMAGVQLEKALKRDDEDDERKLGVFWGFGSFDKLVDALSAERERQWKGIEAAIRPIEPPPSSSGPSLAPRLPLVAIAAMGLGAMSKATLAVALAGTVLGAISFRGWTGPGREPTMALICPEPPPPASAPPLPGAACLSSPAAPLVEPMAAPPEAFSARSSGAKAAPPATATADDLRGLLRREREDRAGATR